MEFLELPDEFRPLIAPDASRRVRAFRFEAKKDGENCRFWGGGWKSKDDPNLDFFEYQVFYLSEAEPAVLCSTGTTWLSNEENLEADYQTTQVALPYHVEQLGRDELIGNWNGAVLVRHGDSLFWKRWEEATRIYPHEIPNFATLAPSEVRAIVDTALTQKESEIAQSLAWFWLSQEERFAQFVACEKGDWREIEALWKALFRIFGATRTDVLIGKLNIAHHALYFPWLSSTENAATMRFFFLWREQWQRYFRPRYFWRKDLPGRLQNFHDEQLQSEIGQPSAHELLEAQLLLSNWAHKNAPHLAPQLLDFPVTPPA